MRTKKEILKEIEPLIGSTMTVEQTTLSEKIIIELLLDIRDSSEDNLPAKCEHDLVEGSYIECKKCGVRNDVIAKITSRVTEETKR